MNHYISFSNFKVILVGFIFGMLSFIMFTSTMNWYQKPLFIIESFHDKHSGHHDGETRLVDQLAKEKPIMAFIFTSEDKIATRATNVKTTWAKRFNEAVFLSTKEDPFFPILALSAAKGWNLIRLGIITIFEKYGDKHTFFLKAQDNNYVIVENLRELLRTMNPDKPLLIGRLIKAKNGTTFMSDDAGYVLSRAGLRRLALAIKTGVEGCAESSASSEEILSHCAEAAGLNLIHAMDKNKAEFFHPYPPRDLFTKYVKEKYPNQTLYEPSQMNEIITSCSDKSVTFFDVQDSCLYVLEYFTYHHYPYGIIRDPELYQKLSRQAVEEQHLNH